MLHSKIGIKQFGFISGFGLIQPSTLAFGFPTLWSRPQEISPQPNTPIQLAPTTATTGQTHPKLSPRSNDQN